MVRVQYVNQEASLNFFMQEVSINFPRKRKKKAVKFVFAVMKILICLLSCSVMKVSCIPGIEPVLCCFRYWEWKDAMVCLQ